MPSLREQVARKIAYVDQIRSAYPDEVKLVLIGHSVGAYICQEVGKDSSPPVMTPVSDVDYPIDRQSSA